MVRRIFIDATIYWYWIANMWKQVQKNMKELKKCNKDHLQIAKKAEE